LNLSIVLYRFLFIFMLSLIVKQISFQFFLGSFARNLKFILSVVFVCILSSASFYILAFLFHNYLGYMLMSIYFSSIFAYLCLFIIVFVGSNLIVEYPLYNYIFIKGKFSGSEILSLLLMINMFAYLFAYLLGFVDPLAWM